MTRILFIIKHTIDIIFISIKDGFNFIRYTEVLPKKNDRIERLQFQLTVGVHSLEKGLSFKKKKKGFGEAKAIKQLNTLLNYINQGYPTDNYAVLETIAIIEAYIRYKKSVGEFPNETYQQAVDRIIKETANRILSQYSKEKHFQHLLCECKQIQSLYETEKQTILELVKNYLRY